MDLDLLGFEDFFEECTTLMAILGAEGEFLGVNHNWSKLLGYTPAQLGGREFLGFVHPEDKSALRDYFEELLDGDRQSVFATRFRSAMGKAHHILWQALPRDDKIYLLGIDTTVAHAEGEVAGFLEAEHTDLEDPALLSSLFQVAPLGIALIDRNGRFVRTNPAFCGIFGYTEYDLMGQPAGILFPKSQSEGVMEAYKDHTAPLDPVCGEFTGCRRDHGEFHLELWSRRLIHHGKPLTVSLALDVSARKQEVDDLVASEAYLRLAIENLPIMVDAFDAGGDILVWNRECERITGFSAEEMVGNPDAMKLMYPDPEYRAKMVAALHTVIAERPVYRRGEWAMTCKDGSEKTIAWSVSGHLQISGFALWAIGEDVTDRIRAEQQLQLQEGGLKANEDQLRLIIENLPIMVDGIDENGNFVLWNSECEHITGFSAKEMLYTQEALTKLYPDPTYRSQVRIAIRDSLNSPPCVRHGEWQMHCKDGSAKTIAWAVNTDIRLPGVAMIGIGADVTERNQALRQLKENEERLRLLVENMPVMLMAYDEAGTLVLWNRHCEGITGYSAKTMLNAGDAAHILFPLPEQRNEWRLWLSSPVFAEWETSVFCADGNYRIIQWTNISGQLPIPGWSRWVIGEDVTVLRNRHRDLDAINALFSAILERTGEGIAVTDQHQAFVYFNEAYCRIYGYAPEELLDAQLSKLMGKGSQSFVYRHYFSFYTGAHGELYRERATAISRDGTPVTGMTSAYLLEQEVGDETRAYILWVVEP